MSTIVVVRKAGVAAIAADSCTSFGSLKMRGSYAVANDKIFEHRAALIGLAGSAAHKRVLEGLLQKHGKYAFGDSNSIFDTMMKIHARMKDQYYLNPVEDKSDPYESTQFEMLVANKHGIFAAYPLREVYEYTRFWALGSGGDYALGAMFASYPVLETAEEIALRGVEAGAEFDSSTAGPFEVRTVKLKP